MRTLQDLTGNTGKVSQIFVKVDKPANIPVVMAELKAHFLPVTTSTRWRSSPRC